MLSRQRDDFTLDDEHQRHDPIARIFAAAFVELRPIPVDTTPRLARRVFLELNEPCGFAAAMDNAFAALGPRCQILVMVMDIALTLNHRCKEGTA